VEEAASPQICAALATPGPDGRSLCLFSSQIGAAASGTAVRFRPLLLHLGADAEEGITVSPLPAVPLGRLMLLRARWPTPPRNATA
jgi:hypothetical protein